MSVQLNDMTQSRLSASGHHVVNRYLDGTIDRHLIRWPLREINRVRAEVAAERARAQAYLDALAATEDRMMVAGWLAEDREAQKTE